jgi:MGT family glycosyltransferase
MPRAHVAVFTYAAAGHVTPLLGLVEELVSRGGRVTWVTTEEFAERVEAAGATVVPHPVSEGVFQGEATGVTAQNVAALSAAQFQQSVDAAEVALAHFTHDVPDLVLYDATVLAVARMLSHRLGCPAVRLFPSFAANDRFNLMERMPEIGRMTAETGVSRMLGEKLGEFLAAYELDVPAGEFLSQVEPLTLAVLPRAFQYAEERFGDEVSFVGPCLGSRARDESWTPPGSGLPVVLVSLGSHAYAEGESFLRECVAAFSDAPWHVVLSVGRHLRPADLGPLPSHMEAHGWLPQTAVLRHAGAFVSGSGMGGTMEAMYFGVPQVAVARMPEQAAIADRVAETGIGVRVPHAEATGERLRSAVTHVLSDAGVRDRVAEFRRHAREAGGASRAADEIGRLLDSLRNAATPAAASSSRAAGSRRPPNPNGPPGGLG